jgi:hypothetical protein
MGVWIRVHYAGESTLRSVYSADCKLVGDLIEIVRNDYKVRSEAITLYQQKQLLNHEIEMEKIINTLVEDEVLDVFIACSPSILNIASSQSVRAVKNQRLQRWIRLKQILPNVSDLEHLAWLHLQPVYGPLIEPTVQKSRTVNINLVETLNHHIQRNLIHHNVQFVQRVMSVLSPLMKTTTCTVHRQLKLNSTLIPDELLFDLMLQTNDTCLAVMVVDPIDDHLMELAMVQALIGQEIVAKDYGVEVVYALITNSREWVWLKNTIYVVEMDKDILQWNYGEDQTDVLQSILSKFNHIVC